MATIDIRQNEDEMVDKISFSPYGYIKAHLDRAVISDEDNNSSIVVEKIDVPYLIQSLQKYMEIYG